MISMCCRSVAAIILFHMTFFRIVRSQDEIRRIFLFVESQISRRFFQATSKNQLRKTENFVSSKINTLKHQCQHGKHYEQLMAKFRKQNCTNEKCWRIWKPRNVEILLKMKFRFVRWVTMLLIWTAIKIKAIDRSTWTMSTKEKEKKSRSRWAEMKYSLKSPFCVSTLNENWNCFKFQCQRSLKKTEEKLVFRLNRSFEQTNFKCLCFLFILTLFPATLFESRSMERNSQKINAIHRIINFCL